MSRKTRSAFALIASMGLLLSACSQESTDDATQTDTGTGTETTSDSTETDDGDVGETSADLPEALAGKDLRIAIVQNSGQGDYFQQYLNGTRQQAEALNITLDTYDAQGNNATQATQLEQAIDSNVDGIIVRHGFADTLCPGVNDAIEKGIPIVIYDVEIQTCAPDAVQTQQSDTEMASLVLDYMVEEAGENIDVGYVNVAGVAPLDRRDVVWQEYKAEHGWNELFKTGTYTASSATDSAPMVDSALKANPGVKAIYAPYDELTKATLTALQQNSGIDDVLVFGADISNADIELMIGEDSAWVATGATDPNAIGAAVTRTLLLQMAGELETLNVEFPPVLVTQEFLREEGISNMDDLRAAMPELNISDVSSADWIPSVTF